MPGYAHTAALSCHVVFSIRVDIQMDCKLWLCGRIWVLCLKPAVDNICLIPLQGIYVLQDNNFRWVTSITPSGAMSEQSRANYLSTAAQPYLYLPCGIIRGEHMLWVGGYIVQGVWKYAGCTEWLGLLVNMPPHTANV
jgi:hypothetical protein